MKKIKNLASKATVLSLGIGLVSGVLPVNGVADAATVGGFNRVSPVSTFVVKDVQQSAVKAATKTTDAAKSVATKTEVTKAEEAKPVVQSSTKPAAQPEEDQTLQAPATLSLVRGGTDFVSLKWDAVPGADWYKVLRNGVEVSLTNNTELKDAGLTPGTPYIYTVVASTYDNKLSAPSVEVRATTLKKQNIQNITVSDEVYTNKSTGFSFELANGATKYYVNRGAAYEWVIEEKNGNYIMQNLGLKGTEEPANVVLKDGKLTFTEPDMNSSTNYTYTIQAVKVINNGVEIVVGTGTAGMTTKANTPVAEKPAASAPAVKTPASATNASSIEAELKIDLKVPATQAPAVSLDAEVKVQAPSVPLAEASEAASALETETIQDTEREETAIEKIFKVLRERELKGLDH